jgi:hypothetical protein
VRLPLGVKQDVGRLEVAVDDAVGVRIMDGTRHLFDQPGRFARRHWLPAKLSIQATTIHEIHHNVRLFSILASVAEVMDWYDVRMVQAGNGFGFTAKARQKLPAIQPIRLNHLDSHQAVEVDLASLVDDTHSPLAQDLYKFEVRNGRH